MHCIALRCMLNLVVKVRVGLILWLYHQRGTITCTETHGNTNTLTYTKHMKTQTRSYGQKHLETQTHSHAQKYMKHKHTHIYRKKHMETQTHSHSHVQKHKCPVNTFRCSWHLFCNNVSIEILCLVLREILQFFGVT